MSHTDEVLLPADEQRAQFSADIDLIDAAYARIREASTDLVGNAFRVEMAERLETQARVNRGLSYRMFGEIADPADGPTTPHYPPTRTYGICCGSGYGSTAAKSGAGFASPRAFGHAAASPDLRCPRSCPR